MLFRQLAILFFLNLGFIQTASFCAASSPAESPQKEDYIKPTPSHYFQGVARIFSRRQNLVYLGVGSGAALTIHGFDDDIVNEIGRDDRTGLFKDVTNALGGTVVTIGGTALTYVAGRVFKNPRLNNTGIYLGEALFTSAVLTLVLKEAFGRERPNGENRLSFPSGHASNTFTIASVIDKRYGYKAGIPAYAAASIVGFARVWTKKHFPSDVLAGATIGVIVGRSFVPDGGNSSSATVFPVVAPRFAGFMMRINF